MKGMYRVVLLVLTAALYVLPASAGNDDTVITFSGKTLTIREATAQIEKQTGKVFGMSEYMDLSKRVDFGTVSVPFVEAVSKIAGTEFDYTLYDNFVLFTKSTMPVAKAEGKSVEDAENESSEAGKAAFTKPAPVVMPVTKIPVVVAASTATKSEIADAVRENTKPIIIDDKQLKQYAAGERKDSIVIKSCVYTGGHRFKSSENEFYTPGDKIMNGYVPESFETAARWQRSKLVLKTNLVYIGATLTPNLDLEFGLGNRSTLDIGAAYNGWNLRGTMGNGNNKKLVHLLAIAEYRYWFCERFSGHFIGAHALGAHYNVGGHDIPLLFKKEFRYEGYAVGVGLSYGYFLPLSKRWGAEFNIGVGVIYKMYDKYGCNKCDKKEGTFKDVYFGPTRIGINLVYVLK